MAAGAVDVGATEAAVRARLAGLRRWNVAMAVLHLGHRWYERNVSRGINSARWVEYALSSSLMMVVIAMLVGIYDVASLLLVFALNATMILFGWLMELHNQTTERTSWTAFWFGCFAGAVPWVAVAIYLAGPPIHRASSTGFSRRCLCSSTCSR